MHLLFCAATEFELAPIAAQLPDLTLPVEFMVTGVGSATTAATLSTRCLSRPPAALINVGVAGALTRDIGLGEVVQVQSDWYGDLGVEERNGDFTPIQGLGLLDTSAPPYTAGKLRLDPRHGRSGPLAHWHRSLGDLRSVRGVTVNTVHGEEESIARFCERSEAEIETMEGAAVFEVALRQNLPLLALRAISNYVEPRNRANWKIEAALDALSGRVLRMLSEWPGPRAA